ncbi:hypothetical protein WJX72_003327 [[Myrmecia] bisecta]|uniref:Uncharacterized protein n=1 Tax=[Myrmecia] bisecta TaxID=41462 RepID=A0AAW1P5L3_9CHLO
MDVEKEWLVEREAFVKKYGRPPSPHPREGPGRPDSVQGHGAVAFNPGGGPDDQEVDQLCQVRTLTEMLAEEESEMMQGAGAANRDRGDNGAIRGVGPDGDKGDSSDSDTTDDAADQGIPPRALSRELEEDDHHKGAGAQARPT